MKIQNNGSSGAAPLDNSRTQPVTPGGAGNGGQTISGHDGDSVSISSISSQVSDANTAESQQRSSRVEELSALHARGGYQVNAANLSRALVSQSLAPGGEA